MSSLLKFTMFGREFNHTTTPWRVAINRHPTTKGQLWGWIEGAPGNQCWSDDGGGSLLMAQAQAVCDEHNKWLEAQKSPGIRMAELLPRITALREEIKAAQDKIDKLSPELREKEAAFAEASFAEVERIGKQ